jgi:membrane associated rhomboid family serine protease
MIPISDDNPAVLKPIVTWAIIIACVLVFIWQLSFTESVEEELIFAFGFVPKNLFDHVVTARLFGVPWPWFTLVTSMFLHGGFLHLGGNMLYLWIFGNNVEDAMGHGRFLAFYVACGMVAALCEGLINPHSGLPILGASGAISGVLAAYVLIYPRTRVRVIIPLGILLYPTKISAFYVVGFWFLLQLFNVLGTKISEPGTAWWAHVGGFIAGIVLTPMLSNFPLFGRYTRGPWS